jgi:phenylalanyl-tRNA synthetase beta chain
MDYLFNKHGIANVWYDEHKPTPEQSKICLWQKGKCAEIKVGNQEIGFLGEVSPSLLKQGKVVVFDIDFDKFKELCSEEWEYRPVSQYPSTVRDLAILVPINVKVIEVMNIINSVGGSLIKDVDLFDIYEGEGLDYNRKSLAFHIIYQAEDRTLRASEINTIQNKIIKTLEKKSQWQVRK